MGDDHEDEASSRDEDDPFEHLLLVGEGASSRFESARHGDQHAFRDLWDDVKRPARGICLGLTDSWADAEDALQEAQIAVWRGLHRCRDESSFRAWVCVIAKNAARDVGRRKARAPKPTDDIPDEPDRATSSTGSFVDGLVGLLDALEAVRRLPDHHREALLLWVSGLEYAEIAAALDARPATVKQWVHRAREQLRRDLDDEL